MIQTSYDPQADSMSAWCAAPGIVAVAAKEVAPDVMLDFDGNGQVIGIEVLGVAGACTSAKRRRRRGRRRSS